MELDSVAEHRYAWYRLLGTVAADEMLTEQGEATNDVAYTYLTRGCRAAQRLLLGYGYGGWRKRSSALTWTGTDATTGGRYCSLPSDFLRAAGNRRKSPLVEANGNRWGVFLEDEDEEQKGNRFRFEGEELWLARNANPPSTVYLEYHYQHPVWNGSLADGSIDFPTDSRFLIVAKAADLAKSESWYVGDAADKQAIREALGDAQEEARKAVRQMRQPKRFQKRKRFADRW